MSTFAVVQAVVLTLVLLASVLAAFGKLLPKTAKRWQSRLSAMLDRPQRGRWLRRLGRWLQPAEAKRGDCGSGDGCSSCCGCAPTPAAPGEPMPLEFKRRS